jgi:hypothetical protein
MIGQLQRTDRLVSNRPHVQGPRAQTTFVFDHEIKMITPIVIGRDTVMEYDKTRHEIAACRRGQGVSPCFNRLAD